MLVAMVEQLADTPLAAVALLGDREQTGLKPLMALVAVVVVVAQT